MTGEEAWRSYWSDFADAFAHPLKANGLLRRFLTNPNVTALYAEAWIRSLTRSMLPQFRVSSGAVIRPGDRLREDHVPQCDMIVWDPSELPALFEKGEFALVPYSSAQAIIEIKRSCSDVSQFQDQLRRQSKCLPSLRRKRVLGVVISHDRPLFSDEVKADWLDRWDSDKGYPMTRLLGPDSTDADVDVDGVFAFIYFLSQVAGHRHLIVQ